MIHIHQGILSEVGASIRGWRERSRNIDGTGGYYPQQTNAGTENQMPHVLTYKWELNFEYTWT